MLTPAKVTLMSALQVSNSSVVGTVPVYLTLHGIDRSLFTIKVNLVAIKGLTHPIIFGQDLLQKYEQVSSAQYSFFTHSKQDFDSLPEGITKYQLTENCIKVPLVPPSEGDTSTLQNIRAFTVAPHSHITIPVRLNNLPFGTKWLFHPLQLSAHPSIPRPLEVIDQHIVLDDPTSLLLTVLNTSDEKITTPAMTTLALLTPLEVHVSQNRLEFSPSETPLDADHDNVIRSFHRRLDESGITDPARRAHFLHEFLNEGSVNLPYVPKDDKGLEILSTDDVTPKSPEELVDLVEVSHLPQEWQKKFKELFTDKVKVFQTHKYHYQKTPLAEASIELKPITKSVIQKQIPLPPSLLDKVQAIIDKMVEAKIVVPHEEPTPLISSILVTKKRNGDIRVLLDARYLNSLTKKRVSCPPTPDYVIMAVHNATYASIFDLSNSYFQIAIRPEDQKYMSFKIPGNPQLYKYCSLPQGFINSSFFLQQLLNKVLKGLKGVYVYMDDITVLTNGPLENHLGSVKVLLDRLLKYNLLLNPKKIQLARTEFELLGITYNLHHGGASARLPKARIAGFQEQARPISRRQLRSMLCSVAYFRRFIPHFSEITYEMHKACLPDPKSGKYAPLTWTPALEKEYTKLLEVINSDCTLQCPNPTKPYVAFTDASSRCMSFLLFQPDPQDRLALVASISKMVPQSMLSQHIYFKEVEALVMGLKSLEFYLRDCVGITVFTDAKGLSFSMVSHYSSPALTRKLIYLSSYPLTIQHVSSIANLADYLSRYNRDDEPTKPDTSQFLSTKDAARLLDALQFDGNIRLTAEDIERCLGQLPPWPAPPSAKKSKPTRTSEVQYGLERMTAPKRSERKIKKPHARINRHFDQRLLDREVKSEPVKPVKPVKFSAFNNKSDENYVKLLNGPLKGSKDQLLAQVKGYLDDTTTSDVDPDAVLTSNEELGVNRLCFRAVNITPLRFEVLHKSDLFPKIHHSFPDAGEDTSEINDVSPSNSAEPIDLNSLSFQAPLDNPAKGQPFKGQVESIPVTNPRDVTNCCALREEDYDCDHTTGFHTAAIIAAVPHSGRISRSDFAECQKADFYIAKLMREHKEHPSGKYEIRDKVFCKRIHKGIYRPLLPKSLLLHAINILHYSALGGHRSVTKIYETLRTRYHYPQLLQAIKSLVASCAICNITKSVHRPMTHAGRFEIMKNPRQAYNVDWIPNVPMVNKYRHIFVVVDTCTGLIRLFPHRNRSAKEAIDSLKSIMMADSTLISILRSDGEPCLSSDEFQKFLSEFNIDHTRSAYGSPQSNSQAERAVAAVKQGLQSFTETFKDNWPSYLPIICIGFNKAVNRYGISPEKYHFGSVSSTVFDLLPENEDWNADNIAKMRETIHARKKKAADIRYEKDRLKTRDLRSLFQVGDFVLVKVLQQHRANQALSHHYVGPYIIEGLEKYSSTAFLRAVHSKHKRKCRIANLKSIPDTYTAVLQPDSLPEET